LAYGQVLASTVALPELAAAPRGAGVDLTVSARPDCASSGDHTESYKARSVDDGKGPWLRVLRSESGTYQLDFSGGARFIFSADAASVAVRNDCADGRVTRHLLIDQVVPLTLSHRGVPLLHASAVVVGGRTVAFVGPSGSGKSTLAASFADDDVLVM